MTTATAAEGWGAPPSPSNVRSLRAQPSPVCTGLSFFVPSRAKGEVSAGTVAES